MWEHFWALFPIICANCLILNNRLLAVTAIIPHFGVLPVALSCVVLPEAGCGSWPPPVWCVDSLAGRRGIVWGVSVPAWCVGVMHWFACDEVRFYRYLRRDVCSGFSLIAAVFRFEAI